MSELLPELLEREETAQRVGITRAAAEAIMRRLPIVQIEGLRSVLLLSMPPSRRAGELSRRTRCSA